MDDLEFLFFFCVDADHAFISRVQRLNLHDIQKRGVNALCISSGEIESAADEAAATEPNAIEIAETYRRMHVTTSRCWEPHWLPSGVHLTRFGPGLRRAPAQ